MRSGPRLLAVIDGYAVEGGFDVAHGIATCYSPTIALQRHSGPGDALGVWGNYETLIDACASLDIDGIRLSPQWARIEPRADEVDDDALARYAEIVSYAKSKGLHVTLSLIDEAWPSWLGLEAWLLPWVVPVFLAHARRVAKAIPATSIVAFSYEDALVTKGYLDASAPPWRHRAKKDAGFVIEQLSVIGEALQSDDEIGPRLLEGWRQGTPLELARMSDAERAELSELHVLSLLRGVGPTATKEGLLVQRDGSWLVGPLAEELTVLRK